jgi:hypothetical protein
MWMHRRSPPLRIKIKLPNHMENQIQSAPPIASHALFASLIHDLKSKTITLKDAANRLRTEGKMRCNCDLDNWEPLKSTGHSHVCLIHITATGLKNSPYDYVANSHV